MKGEYPFAQAAEVMKVIAHPIRLSIIALLEDKKLKVGDIQAVMGTKQAVTSQHLNAMAAKGILGREKNGNEVFYYVERKEVYKLLSCIKGCCA